MIIGITYHNNPGFCSYVSVYPQSKNTAESKNYVAKKIIVLPGGGGGIISRYVQKMITPQAKIKLIVDIIAGIRISQFKYMF